MVRTLIASVLGGIILHVVSFVSWMVLPFHADTMRTTPEETAVVATLSGALGEDGWYQFPSYPETDPDLSEEEAAAAMETFNNRHAAGPIITVFYSAEGFTPMSPVTIGIGLLIYIGVALVVAFGMTKLAQPSPHYLKRVLFITGAGVITVFMCDLNYWNWMNFPLDFTVAFIVDHIVAWFLAGLVMAAILRPPRATPPLA